MMCLDVMAIREKINDESDMKVWVEEEDWQSTSVILWRSVWEYGMKIDWFHILHFSKPVLHLVIVYHLLISFFHFPHALFLCMTVPKVLMAYLSYTAVSFNVSLHPHHICRELCWGIYLNFQHLHLLAIDTLHCTSLASTFYDLKINCLTHWSFRIGDLNVVHIYLNFLSFEICTEKRQFLSATCVLFLDSKSFN